MVSNYHCRCYVCKLMFNPYAGMVKYYCRDCRISRLGEVLEDRKQRLWELNNK